MEFLSAVVEQRFLQNALAAGLLASVGCGFMGTYVVVRRIGYLAGGIAHAALGGMGVAYFAGIDPLLGALAAALLAALVLAWVTLAWRQREDTVISALWAVGMAVGILFLSATPGYKVDLMSYLFGNILMVSSRDLWLMGILDAVVVGLTLAFYKQLVAVAFDQEFARLRGVRVTAVYVLLLCLVALTVVVLIRVVGLILVIALLTLPAAIAGQWFQSLRSMIVVATLLGAGLTSGGLALAWVPDWPAGATIILLAGVVYLTSTTITRGRTHLRLPRGRKAAARPEPDPAPDTGH